MKEYIIGKNEANQRLDKYLHKLLKEASKRFPLQDAPKEEHYLKRKES